jgi:hypothetical protein
MRLPRPSRLLLPLLLPLLLLAAVPEALAAQSGRDRPSAAEPYDAEPYDAEPGLEAADSAGSADVLSPRERARLDDRLRRQGERERLRRRTEGEDGRLSPAPRRPGERAPAAAAPRTALPSSGRIRVGVATELEEYVAAGDDGDPLRFFVTSAADGYVTLLTGAGGADLTVLAPNELVAELPIRAGETLEFPLPEWQYQGYELVPSLPRGRTRSQQVVVAVVTRRPAPLPISRDPGLSSEARYGYTLPARVVQRWLAGIPLAERGVAQTLFLVRAP